MKMYVLLAMSDLLALLKIATICRVMVKEIERRKAGTADEWCVQSAKSSSQWEAKGWCLKKCPKPW